MRQEILKSITYEKPNFTTINEASKQEEERTLKGGALCRRSMMGTSGASCINTAFNCPTYGPTSPKSVKRIIIKMSMPRTDAFRQGGLRSFVGCADFQSSALVSRLVVLRFPAEEVYSVSIFLDQKYNLLKLKWAKQAVGYGFNQFERFACR